MRAIVRDEYTPTADALRLRELPVPVPGAGQVLVRVHAASFGQDVWHVMAGLPLLARPAFGLPRPKQPVLGGDLAGIVEAVGDGVAGFAIGDRVLGRGDGTFADCAIARAELLAVLPDAVDWVTAAALPVSGSTALNAVRAGRVREGRRVLVIGAAGGVGHLIVQLAVDAGAVVTGVCRPEADDFVRSLGAVRTLDYGFADRPADADGRYDIILDTGGRRKLRLLRRHLASDGTIVVVGGEGGGSVLGGFQRSIFAPLAAIGSKQRMVGLVSTDSGPVLAELAALVASGRIRPRVHATLPLERAADGMRMMRAGGVRGKIALEL